MEPEKAARGLAINRLLIGSLLTLFPTRTARGWIARHSRNEGARLFARALGARDVGLAVGMLGALREGTPARPWAQAAVLADGVDFGATFAARHALPAGSLGFGLLMSGASTALGLWLSSTLD
jgi:hypothetical protein